MAQSRKLELAREEGNGRETWSLRIHSQFNSLFLLLLLFPISISWIFYEIVSHSHESACCCSSHFNSIRSSFLTTFYSKKWMSLPLRYVARSDFSIKRSCESFHIFYFIYTELEPNTCSKVLLMLSSVWAHKCVSLIAFNIRFTCEFHFRTF